jgi:hypothetical protein
LTNSWSQERDTSTTRAMARRLKCSPSRRRMRERFSSLTGPFCGAATKRRPHGRQRKVGVPAVLDPLRTTWVAAQRGTVVDARVVVFISSAYDYAAWRATTPTRQPGNFPHLVLQSTSACHLARIRGRE